MDQSNSLSYQITLKSNIDYSCASSSYISSPMFHLNMSELTIGWTRKLKFVLRKSSLETRVTKLCTAKISKVMLEVFRSTKLDMRGWTPRCTNFDGTFSFVRRGEQHHSWCMLTKRIAVSRAYRDKNGWRLLVPCLASFNLKAFIVKLWATN